MTTFDVIIYHNPRCNTSRMVLDTILTSGFEPHVIEYLKTPPTVAMLQLLAVRAGVDLSEFVRVKEAAYNELSLDQIKNNEELADIMHRHPELINRPIVVSPAGVRLCRPADLVHELLVPCE